MFFHITNIVAPNFTFPIFSGIVSIFTSSTMPRKGVDIVTSQQTSTMHRVSIGLIAVSLGLISLALASALFASPGASFLFIPNTVETQSTPSTATAVTLSWTAPGDDGSVGQAASYDIRYATNPITDQNFSSALAVPGTPSPAVAGSTESVSVTNLQPSTTYFFALKTTDDAGNVSALSNVATKTTSALAQACVPTYTCTDWTVCANSTQTRNCTVTNGCPAGLDAPIVTQSCTMPAVIPPTTPGGAIGGTMGEPVRVNTNILVAGLAPGSLPLVRVIDPVKKKTTKEFLAFDRKDRNGVNVTAGDITGDAVADVIVGTGAGSNALVKVFTPAGKQVASFSPYPTEQKTGVSVATGDMNGDGIDEVITVPAKSTSQVRIWSFDNSTKKFKQLAQGFAYDRSARQGFTVTAGDLNADGRAEVVVAPRANGRSIAVVRLDEQNAVRLVKRFNPYPIQFTSGLTVTIGDVYGNNRPVIVVSGGPNYYSDIKLFDINGRQQGNFLAISKAFRNGLSLTTQDVNSDGRAEIVSGSYQKGEPSIYVYRYDSLKKKFSRIQNYLAFPRTTQVGLRLGGS